ncbi:MAG TPA: oxygen-independent coproporphyrinogen III oxidase [Chlamydiales bacterium]|nr:oxygen-independent coproporphyrinogen III oxidase [Chlamydiales bacterium]
MDLIQIDPRLLAKWNRPVPRYTSYPTAPQFRAIDASVVEEKFSLFDKSKKPLSLYIHIPFCKTMCLFCGCSVILNRKPERQTTYLDHLLREIALTAGRFSARRVVTQLHLGGGTPTSLSEEEFERLMRHLHIHFAFERNAEISIEIDPRTATLGKMTALKGLGFNRVSFGVQDLDPVVQEAVKRRQSEEMTVLTYWMARELGFSGINIDLIYGLPFQTAESFAKTAEKLVALKPDRIAFYSYAKIPWLKAHQKAIPDETLPTTEEKFRIYVEARERFMRGGYTAIGMDHFALHSDSIAEAYREKKLTRNFQGYSISLAEDMLGFGITSIGFLENCYLQNEKELEAYQNCIAKGLFPIQRGFSLSEEDIRRRWIIQSLMCHFELDKAVYEKTFGKPFDYPTEELKKEGLLEETPQKLIPTPVGRLFIRLVAAAFDGYLAKGQFSKAV